MLQRIKDYNHSEIETTIMNAQEDIIKHVKICHDNIKAMDELQKLDNFTIIDSVVNIDAAIEKLNNRNIKFVKMIEEKLKFISECVLISINPNGH